MPMLGAQYVNPWFLLAHAHLFLKVGHNIERTKESILGIIKEVGTLADPQFRTEYQRCGPRITLFERRINRVLQLCYRM